MTFLCKGRAVLVGSHLRLRICWFQDQNVNKDRMVEIIAAVPRAATRWRCCSILAKPQQSTNLCWGFQFQ